MTTLKDFIVAAVDELHRTVLYELRDLPPEKLSWRPGPKANNVIFLFWHFMRSEDNLLSRLQGKPPIWQAEEWFQKFGLEADSQGTGFNPEEVDKFSLPLPALMPYAEKVMATTLQYLKNLEEKKLEETPDPQRANRTLEWLLRNIIIAHGWWHVGEIKFIKGLQGIPGRI